jgi:hypothetical protein
MAFKLFSVLCLVAMYCWTAFSQERSGFTMLTKEEELVARVQAERGKIVVVLFLAGEGPSEALLQGIPRLLKNDTTIVPVSCWGEPHVRLLLTEANVPPPWFAGGCEYGASTLKQVNVVDRRLDVTPTAFVIDGNGKYIARIDGNSIEKIEQAVQKARGVAVLTSSRPNIPPESPAQAVISAPRKSLPPGHDLRLTLRTGEIIDLKSARVRGLRTEKSDEPIPAFIKPMPRVIMKDGIRWTSMPIDNIRAIRNSNPKIIFANDGRQIKTEIINGSPIGWLGGSQLQLTGIRQIAGQQINFNNHFSNFRQVDFNNGHCRIMGFDAIAFDIQNCQVLENDVRPAHETSRWPYILPGLSLNSSVYLYIDRQSVPVEIAQLKKIEIIPANIDGSDSKLQWKITLRDGSMVRTRPAFESIFGKEDNGAIVDVAANEDYNKLAAIEFPDEIGFLTLTTLEKGGYVEVDGNTVGSVAPRKDFTTWLPAGTYNVEVKDISGFTWRRRFQVSAKTQAFAEVKLADQPDSAPMISQWNEDTASRRKLNEAFISGTIAVAFTVGTDGRAHDVKVVRSLNATADKYIVNSLSQSIFIPAHSGGRPQNYQVQMEYVLRNKDRMNQFITPLFPWQLED